MSIRGAAGAADPGPLTPRFKESGALFAEKWKKTNKAERTWGENFPKDKPYYMVDSKTGKHYVNEPSCLMRRKFLGLFTLASSPVVLGTLLAVGIISLHNPLFLGLFLLACIHPTLLVLNSCFVLAKGDVSGFLLRLITIPWVYLELSFTALIGMYDPQIGRVHWANVIERYYGSLLSFLFRNKIEWSLPLFGICMQPQEWVVNEWTKDRKKSIEWETLKDYLNREKVHSARELFFTLYNKTQVEIERPFALAILKDLLSDPKTKPFAEEHLLPVVERINDRGNSKEWKTLKGFVQAGDVNKAQAMVFSLYLQEPANSQKPFVQALVSDLLEDPTTEAFARTHLQPPLEKIEWMQKNGSDFSIKELKGMISRFCRGGVGDKYIAFVAVQVMLIESPEKAKKRLVPLLLRTLALVKDRVLLKEAFFALYNDVEHKLFALERYQALQEDEETEDFVDMWLAPYLHIHQLLVDNQIEEARESLSDLTTRQGEEFALDVWDHLSQDPTTKQLAERLKMPSILSVSSSSTRASQEPL